MQFKDYYKVIGVAPQATADQLKAAYRTLARKLHPDVNKEAGAEKRFTDLGEAHEVLKDPERRAAYDQLRAAGWREGQEMDPPPAARGAQGARRTTRTGGTESGNAAQFSDFFESLFGPQASGGERHGGFERSAYHERGEDVTYALAVSLEEAYSGGERQLTFQLPDQPGDHVRTINVKIPKGVLAGTRMRLRGQGHPGSAAASNGDLFLEIGLAPHPLYAVSGSDVSLTVPIAPWEAALGAQVAVPTLGGTVTATIPAGAQQGQKLRLKGRGLPTEPPGDQYLILSIALPPSASEKAKGLYRDLAAESAFNPRAALGV